MYKAGAEMPVPKKDPHFSSKGETQLLQNIMKDVEVLWGTWVKTEYFVHLNTRLADFV